MNQIAKLPYLNAYQSLTQAWPSFLPELPEESVLEELWVRPMEVQKGDGVLIARTGLFFEGNIAFGIPGVDAVSILLAAQGTGTAIPIEVQIRPEFALRLNDVPLALRFSKDLLKPVRKTPAAANAPARWEVDPNAPEVVVQFAEISLEIDADGNIGFGLDGGIDLPPSMIGDTGVVVEAQGVTLHLDANAPPPGQPAGTKGLAIGSASIYLPGEIGEVVGPLTLSNAFIGNGGFTGRVATTFPGGLTADLFGMQFRLDAVEIGFVQNALTASRIAGSITLPFFDAPVPVEIAINLNGGFTIRLGSAASGLYTLTKPGLLEFELESLGFSVEGNLFTAQMSGSIRPLVGGIDWPGFRVEELSIDSEGNVHVDGGWIDLRDQYALNFHGFTLEISQFGLGTEEDGTRWIGVSGGLKLVDGLKAGASVKGLRISWGDSGPPSVSFEGVGVEFEIPDVLRFKGEVAYRELTVGAEKVHRFDGAIDLDLLCLNMTIDAKLVIGTASGPDGSYTFLGIYLGVDLPAGIPLWSTGLALYGLEGLFALNMEPDRREGEPWYGMAPEEGWYKRPQIGVTDINNKWVNRKDSLAVGAGITIGTLPDNGLTFNGSMLLAIVFPGPVILIEGKANILKERASLGDDPLFRALVVLDFRAGDMLVGIDMRYKFGDAAELIDISASAEMYFSFSDPTAWHLYLGQREPRERRIRAKILSLFEANAYYMLDARSLAYGAWVGYDADWRFGPVKVELEAWMETNVKVSWAPPHFYGNLWAHGKISISVFGFGFGLSLDAYLEGDVYDPFRVFARLEVEVGLPWPLPDFSVEITLEWSDPPAWPLPMVPVKDVAIEHLKVGTSWSLPRGANLLEPSYVGADGLRLNWDANLNAGYNAGRAPPANAPVVPLDCRPRITFARNTHDKALVGVMVTPVSPDRERIGDPEADEGPVNIRYELAEVAVEAWTGAAWTPVARKGETPDPAVPTLYGSWAPIPAMPDGGGQTQGQTKLWLWSKNPFDYTRRTGREWDDWISGRYPDMPCIRRPEQTLRCWDFAAVPTGPLLTEEVPLWQLRWWRHPASDGPTLIWGEPDFPDVRVIAPDNTLSNKGICLSSSRKVGDRPARNFLVILLPDLPNHGATVHCHDPEGVFAAAFAADGSSAGAFGGRAPDFSVDFNLKDTRAIVLMWNGRMCLWRVCIKEGASQQEIDEAAVIATHNVTETERWKQTGAVLKPDTDYRIRIRTRIDAAGSAPLSGTRTVEQVEFAYFRTEGAPGLANLSVPLAAPEPETAALRNEQGEFVLVDGTPAGARRALDSALNTLAPYVAQTLPVTVPGAGEARPLPRPVYRAYDLAVMLNEDYVSQMYRMSGRDLTLYVFDSNNRPMRDAAGRLIAIASDWDVATDLELDQHERTWVETVNASSCAGIDTALIPHDETLATTGLVLLPDFVHQARLTPLLVHEFFAAPLAAGAQASGTGARLGRWEVQDTGGLSAPSVWRIGETGAPPVRHVEQTSDIRSQPDDGRFPAKDGTVLFLAPDGRLSATHPSQPANWTDYRLTVTLRNADNDALGVVFRRATGQRYYRFAMDRERGYRRLTRHLDGAVLILAEDDFTFRTDQDYTVTVEAIGADIAVYLDGEAVFRVTDATHDRGGIGLYCWASQGARFSDIRVDDFRDTARAVYAYDFTTSVYTHFAHQMHAFEDEVWTGTLPAAELAAVRAGSAPLASAPVAAEGRAWAAAEAQPGLKALLAQAPTELELTRIGEGTAGALLLRCPEPLTPARVRLELWRSEEPLPDAGRPGTLKIADITRSASDPNAESVGLIVRAAHDPSGSVVERRRLPGPIAPEPPGATLIEDRFDGMAGVLFEETFGPQAIDLYEIAAAGSPAASWSVSGSRIVQGANTFDGAFSGANLLKRGTEARFGSPDWTDVALNVTLNSGDDDSIGLIFRAAADDSFMRFELNGQFGYARLVHVDGATARLLWSAPFTLAQDRDYALRVLVYRRRIVVFLDGAHLLDLEDGDIPLRGRAALWCWANVAARFAAISVESQHGDPLLWSPALDTLDGFTVLNAPGAVDGPSDWTVVGGGIVQSSAIRVPGPGAEAPGTMLVGGRDWADVVATVTVTPGGTDAFGIAVRVASPTTCYRFSVSGAPAYRRLVKVVNGTATTLWQQAAGYPPGTSHRVTLRAEGPRLTVWLDGMRLADVTDDAIPSGRVALYTWGNAGTRFDALRVFDGARRLGRWRIVDAGTVEGPSRWRMRSGQLVQSSNLNGGLADAASPVKPGTMAVSGDPAWSDYRIAAVIQSDDDDAIGIVARYTDPRNYYYLALDAQRDYRRFVRVRNGVYTTLWTATGGYRPGDIDRLALDCVGDRFTAYLGETRLFSVSDDAHPAGQVGLYAWANAKARFHRIEVTEPGLSARALLADDFAGPGLGSWTVVDTGYVSGPSAWSVAGGTLRQDSNIRSMPSTPTGPEKEGTYVLTGDPSWMDVILEVDVTPEDDDAFGIMFRVRDNDNYYRFTMDRQRNLRQLAVKAAGAWTVLWECRRDHATDRRYRLTLLAEGPKITGYLDGILMFEAEDTTHAAGRAGLYSWAMAGLVFERFRAYPIALGTQWTIDEDFSVLRSFRWQFADDGSAGGGAGAFAVADGGLVRTAADPARAAATVAEAGEAGWTDYRAATILRADGPGPVGLEVRRSAAGCYRFTVDTGGTLRLLRVDAGGVTELWTGNGPVEPDRDHALTVDCTGARITAWLDGDRVASVVDTGGPSAGKIGLWAGAHAGVRFAMARVGLPVWEPHYRFTGEDVMADGTRLRILSGAAGEPHPARPLEETRFATGTGATGEIRLGAEAVDLRIAGPEGPGHAARFLPDASFAQVSARRLSRADGTAMLILAEAGVLPAGAYRLRATFRRDISAADPAAPVLSESGETGDEVVDLRFSL